jgi:hypothetical protein
MNHESIFYKGRMNWLTEIQFFRKDLQRIKLEVRSMENTVPNDEDEKARIKCFNDSIKVIDSDLDYTEKKILLSLNNGKNYWVDPYGNSLNSPEANNMENDLYDRMKNCYTGLIELLRSISNFSHTNHSGLAAE